MKYTYRLYTIVSFAQVSYCTSSVYMYIIGVHVRHLKCFADDEDCKTLIGAVDYAWLFTYAVFLVGR